MSQAIKMTLAMKKLPDEQPVYFKVDGGRFDAERTIKLNANTKYRFELCFRPPQLLDTFNVHGGNIEYELKKRDENQSLYTADWLSNGLDIDKKGKRHQVPILIDVQGQGTIKTSLQVKVYKESDKDHANWGTTVSYIEYECQRPEGSTFVDVLKQTFR